MANDRRKAKLAALEAIRSDRGPEAIVAALGRMLRDGSDDPGCQAANALAQALRDLDYRDPAPFLAGLAHVRMEPVWGGRVDVAGPLRATCAQALVASDIDPHVLLSLLVDRFVDPDKWVRVDVARAIAQLDRPESALLLRLKALAGDPDAEVIGQCLTSLLVLQADAAIDFVARFLDDPNDDLRLEALGALGSSKRIAAFARIEQFWHATIEPRIRRAIVFALVSSPHREAAAFLLALVDEAEESLASAAIESLASSRFRHEFRARVESALAGRKNERLHRAFETAFADD